MPQTTEESNLVKLIKCLKQGEKRYVTQQLSKHKKENNLLKLYQLIARSNAIKEADIRKKIKDKKFSSQLSINKHKLYIAILDALQQFHSKTSPYTQVLSMVHQAHLLYSKGLMKAMEELLVKATVFAEIYELRGLQLEILNLRQRAQKSDSPEIVAKIQQLSRQLIEERQLNQLFNQSLMCEVLPGSRLSAQQKNNLKKISDVALKNKNTSFTTSYFRIRTCFTYYAIINDYFKSYEWALKLMALFKKFPQMLQLEMWRIEYVESLKNFIPSFDFLGKNTLNDFVYEETKRMDVPDVYKGSILINILDSYIQAGAFQENEKKINTIQKHLTDYTKHLSFPNKITFLFNLAILNFGMKKYSQALSWLNEIINSPDRKVNTSISIITRLIRLIVFYELGHTDILENHLRSTQRYVAKQENRYQIDLTILKCIRKIIDITEKHRLIAIMKEIRNELIQLSTNASESITLYYFDFVSWCDSKIEGQPFATIVQRKNKERLKTLKPLP